MNSIFSRVSIRTYLEKDVSDEVISALLRAAMAAPSAHNQQPWEFYVVKNRDVLQKLSKSSDFTICAENAPAAIVVCKRGGLESPEYADQDLGACCENILLEAVTQGLGAVWLGIAPVAERMAAARAALCLPAELSVFSIIAFGYPARERAQKDRFDENRIHYVL